MPRSDIFHEAVKNALIGDGWTITHDPYLLGYGSRTLYVDLGAEMPIGAEKEGRKIAVEIKSFLGPSNISDLERALGQFFLYRFLLARVEEDRVLYLAVPEEAFAEVLDLAEGRDLVATERIRIVVYNPAEEAIVRWIE
jgi:hypothetical protein